MRAIQNRADVFLLVTTFYNAIRKDPLLGPIFNKHIQEHQWPEHLDKLTDFWMTNLFGITCFKGNPTQAHSKVDARLHYTIAPHHFGQWLNVWIATIDDLFEGALADKAKNTARKMATGQYLAIWQNRQKTK